MSVLYRVLIKETGMELNMHYTRINIVLDRAESPLGPTICEKYLSNGIFKGMQWRPSVQNVFFYVSYS